jgi:small GTP-binding protein
MPGTKKKEVRILCLGLDGAGKTQLLYRLKLNEAVTTTPTIGFNVETVTAKGGAKPATIWDVGGQDRIRPLWKHYTNDTDGLIYVVDASAPDRYEEALKEMRNILAELSGVTVVVVANKTDLCTAAELERSVGSLRARLASIRGKTEIVTCSAKKDDGERLFNDLARELGFSKSKDGPPKKTGGWAAVDNSKKKDAAKPLEFENEAVRKSDENDDDG